MDDLVKGLTFLIAFALIGCVLIFEQKWIIGLNKAKEQVGLRYKIKTTTKTNQAESMLVKVFGVILILIGIASFIFYLL